MPEPSSPATRNCLNCGTPLQGPFCSACGQRAIAAYPSVRQMIGDAWEELSGYDGRLARTFRVLLRHPGALTIHTMEGHRARYVSPVRLYLLASLVYFFCAATIPNIRPPASAVMPGSGTVISIDRSGFSSSLSPEDRERALKDLERAPGWARAFIRPFVMDPAAFRDGFARILPRLLFALVPVFAGIVALFYRRRPMTQHLAFAVHLHAAVFVTLAVRELSQLARSLMVLRIFEVGAALVVLIYALLAFRTVYRESWPRVLVKGAGIAGLYWVVGIIGLTATFAWIVVMRR